MEHPMDKLFKSGLDDRQLAFNEKHWQAMETLLDRRKKRRAIFWWFGGALILAALIWALNFDDGQDTLASQLNTHPTVHTTDHTYNDPNDTTDITFNTTPTINHYAETRVEQLTGSPQRINGNSGPKGKSTEVETGLNPSNEIPTQINTPSEKPHIGNTSPESSPTGLKPEATNTSPINGELRMATVDPDSSLEEAKPTAIKPENSVEPKHTTDSIADLETTDSLSTDSLESVVMDSLTMVSSDSSLASNMDTVIQAPKDSLITPPTLAIDTTVIEPDSSISSSWLAFTGFGNGPVRSLLSGTASPLLARRQAAETSEATPLFQLGLLRQLGNWQFGFGLELQKLSDQVDYPSEDLSYWEVDDLSTWQVTNNSFWDHIDSVFIQGTWNYTDSVWVLDYDSIFQPNYDSTYFDQQLLALRTKNELQYLNIPLFGGYHYEGNKWGLSAVGGPSFSILMRNKGSILRSDLNGYETLDVSAGLRKLIVNLHLQGEVYYRISPHFQIGVGPFARMQLSSAWKKDGIEQRYRQLGYRVSLNYRW